MKPITTLRVGDSMWLFIITVLAAVATGLKRIVIYFIDDEIQRRERNGED